MRPRIILTAAAALLATLSTAGPAAATLSTAGPAAATAATTVTPGTEANLRTATHGEALAFATYTAFADEADRSGQPGIATLFRTTAAQERDEHFAEEAAFAGFVGDPAANLRTAIQAELSESTDLYPAYARQARADGDRAAAQLFQELAADEAQHRALLRQALRALDGRSDDPRPPAADPVQIVAGPARSHGRTLDNLKAALRDEAFASARYRLFAASATGQDKAALGRLFAGLSDIERLEHFAALANLAGLVGGVRADLSAAITGENTEATVMYPTYAAAAIAAGDTAVGELLTEIASDEAGHRDAYAAALAGL